MNFEIPCGLLLGLSLLEVGGQSQAGEGQSQPADQLQGSTDGRDGAPGDTGPAGATDDQQI